MNQAFEPACTPIAPPWEAPQVIPAQLRRVNNLIFRKIGHQQVMLMLAQLNFCLSEMAASILWR